MGKLGINTAKVSYNIASDAAQAWTSGLLDFAPNGNDIAGLNDAYITLLRGLSQEDAKVVASTIQSIDKMDINAWEELPYLLENSGIENLRIESYYNGIPTDENHANNAITIARSKNIFVRVRE